MKACSFAITYPKRFPTFHLENTTNLSTNKNLLPVNWIFIFEPLLSEIVKFSKSLKEFVYEPFCQQVNYKFQFT